MYEVRTVRDYAFGALKNPASISDVTLTSDDFAALPSIFSTTVTMPITLGDPATHTYEVVWITAHTAGSTSVTVVRGREGSEAQPWPAKTAWACSATARDLQIDVTNRAALPTDAAVGTRAVMRESRELADRQPNGWYTPLSANPSDVVTSGGSIPAGNSPLLKVIRVQGNTDGGGRISATLPSGAFPNGVMSALAIMGSGQYGTSCLLDGFEHTTSATRVNLLVRRASGDIASNNPVIVHVWAIGF